MKPKRLKPEYIEKLGQVNLSKGQEEVLKLILSDNSKKEDHKFFRTRDVVFEALVRQQLGADGYAKLMGQATEMAKTLVLLSKQRNPATND